MMRAILTTLAFLAPSSAVAFNVGESPCSKPILPAPHVGGYEIWAGGNALAGDLEASLIRVQQEIGAVEGSTVTFAAPIPDNGSLYTYTGQWDDGISQVGLMDNVDFANQFPDAGAWGKYWVDNVTCDIWEQDVIFPEITVGRNIDWTWLEPAAENDEYWNAGIDGPTSGGEYATRTLMHEVLHTLGLNHVDDKYSMMNYGIQPFVTDVTDGRVVPLPDDQAALRYLYAGGAGTYDVSLTNTYPNYSTVSNGVVYQNQLCEVSGGVGLSSTLFDSTTELIGDYTCGETASGDPGPTQVCQGDWIFTRATLNNNSTGFLVQQPVEKLYFSVVPTLAGAIPSPTTHQNWSIPRTSSLRQRSWIVPEITPGLYYVIAEADLNGDDRPNNDVIPLRGQIEVVAPCP